VNDIEQRKGETNIMMMMVMMMMMIDRISFYSFTDFNKNLAPI